MVEPLRAPFPWFGGKRNVADEVWKRFGDVANYVEPFFGSGAVMLARPHEPKTETINDADGFVANFWRAVKADPEAVARHADHPVIEADLHARHYWLITAGAARLKHLLGTPDGYDAKVAGWWCWGACAWIGNGWCSGEGPWAWGGEGWINLKLPHVGDAGRGINRQLPHVGNAGRGINRQLPHVGNAGQGIESERSAFIADWILRLSRRLRGVRVAHGDWSRVCGDSVTHRHGLTGVFLDPPYPTNPDLYTHGCDEVAGKAREWAIANGQRKDMRIALCGYDGEHEFPEGWTAFRWKARGGYGSQGDGDGRANSARETIWFSPHCLGDTQVKQTSIFDFLGQGTAA